MEALTSDIERGVTELLDRIDSMGGTLAAIEAGYIQSEIQDAAFRAQQRVDSGESTVVGVNAFVEATPPIEVFRNDPDGEARQIARVRAVRASRSQTDCTAALAAVERAARDCSNLVPPILAAVERHVTLGEIAATLRAVFGEHHETSVA